MEGLVSDRAPPRSYHETMSARASSALFCPCWQLASQPGGPGFLPSHGSVPPCAERVMSLHLSPLTASSHIPASSSSHPGSLPDLPLFPTLTGPGATRSPPPCSTSSATPSPRPPHNCPSSFLLLPPPSILHTAAGASCEKLPSRPVTLLLRPLCGFHRTQNKIQPP